MSSRTGFLYFAAIVAAISPCVAQTATPAPPAAASAGSKPAPPAPVATLRAAAQLVVVDVVVTGSNSKPVHGLKTSDFALTENGVPQVIKNFEEHTALTTADATKFAPMPAMPPGIFTNYTPAPANGAVNLILLDALNTPMRDQSYVRQQLLAYLKATPPGTRIAIFGLTSRLIMLQGFTSNPELLKRVLEKSLAKGSPLLNDQVGGGGIQSSQADMLEDLNIAGAAEMVANLREFDAVEKSFKMETRAEITLAAMNQIARYLSNLPGRKNLIWFSGSFPISIMPDTTSGLQNPFEGDVNLEEEFRETMSLLARSQVAAYPIDARGLMTPPVFDASTERNYASPRGGMRMNQDLMAFYRDTGNEHSTMRELANATGGHAFVNTNGLTQAVGAAIDNGSNFYSLSYTPTNSERDGKMRKIKVKLARQGFTLAYRKGYYADKPAKPTSSEAKTDVPVAASTDLTPSQSLHLAMTRGAPVPGEILLKICVMPMTPATQTEDKVAPANVLTEKVKGPFRRYSVDYAINSGDLVFLREVDGKVHADFDLVIFVYDADGWLVNSLQNTAHVAGPLDEIRKSITKGVLCHQEISAPAKGEYFFRIAVHDRHRDHYGAVEVATSDVRNLKPVVLPAVVSPAETTK